MIILAFIIIVIFLAAVFTFRCVNEKKQNDTDNTPIESVDVMDEPETVEDFGDLSDEETNEQLIDMANKMEVVPDKE